MRESLIKALPRVEILSLIEPCLVALEACADAHHWGCEISALGQDVRLSAPQYHRPYVRDAETIAKFADDLEVHNGQASNIKQVCIDMSAAFIKGVTDNLLEAEITFDKFHAVKLVNDAVDKVCRAKSKGRPELKRTRYLWLRNEPSLSARAAGSSPC